MEEQVKRKYRQYEEQGNDLQKNIYLTTLHYRNEVLFYEVLSEHLQEMLLIIYDPTIGIAIEEYSHDYYRSNHITQQVQDAMWQTIYQ